MRKPLLTAALCVLPLAVAACQSTAPPGARPETVSAAAYPQVTASGKLDRYVVVDRPTIERSPSGAMTVSVPVRVDRELEIPTQYRFLFFNDRGKALNPEQDWQYRVLPARTQEFIQGSSLHAEATDWRLEIRPAR